MKKETVTLNAARRRRKKKSVPLLGVTIHRNLISLELFTCRQRTTMMMRRIKSANNFDEDRFYFRVQRKEIERKAPRNGTSERTNDRAKEPN